MYSLKEYLQIINYNTEKKLKRKKFYILIVIISIFCIIFFSFGFISCYAFNYIMNKKKIVTKQNNNLFQMQTFDEGENTKKLNIKILKMVQRIFNEKHKVNINKVENKIKLNKQNYYEKFKSKIHIAFTLDPNYILETMLTLTSIMATQNKSTKIIFHFGVIKNFDAKKMFKIYQLKEKINNLTEFNFYYLEGAMKKMRNFHPKGEACPGKFELPELLPDDVERILLFDAGDVLVFKDLTELYNYNMKNYWVLGPPEPWCIESFVKIYNITKYINIGSILINVKKLKENNFWETYTKKRYLKLGGAVDQTLFNIVVPDNKKGYFPFRLGGYSIFCNNKNSDNLKFHYFGFEKWLKSKLLYFIFSIKSIYEIHKYLFKKYSIFLTIIITNFYEKKVSSLKK